MAPLALVLAGEEVTGSFATGAFLAGVCGLAQGLGAPWRGRRLDRPDRPGRPAAIAVELATSAAFFTALTAGLFAGAPVAVLAVLAAGAGVFASALPGGYLARLPTVVPSSMLSRAFTATAVSVELSWVLGPLLVAGTTLVAPASAAVGLVALSLIVAIASQAGLPVRTWTAPGEEETAQPPWRNPAARRTYALAALVATGFGIIDSSLPALLGDVGLTPALAGVLIGFPAGASVVTGSILLLRGTDLQNHRTGTAAALGAIAGAALIPLGLVSSFAGIAVVLAVAGMTMAPMNAVFSHVLHDTLAVGRRAEGFTLLHASLRMGIGAGGAVSAVLLPRLGAAGLVSAAGLVPLIGCGLLVGPVGRRRVAPSG